MNKHSITEQNVSVWSLVSFDGIASEKEAKMRPLMSELLRKASSSWMDDSKQREV